MAKNNAHVTPITVKDIVKDEHYSLTYTEKILQGLRGHNIVASFHGSQGGYVLARHPSQITLKEIIDVLEEQTFETFCQPEVRKDIVCNHFPSCGVRPIWEKTKELIDNYYGSITLEMITNNEIKSPEMSGVKKK